MSFELAVAKLEDVAFFQEGPGILAKDFRSNGVPLLRLKSIEGTYATLNGCNYLDPEKVQRKWNHFKTKKGDLLISTSASLGRVSIVTAESEGAIPYTGIIRFRSKSSSLIDSYLRAYLSSSEFIRQAQSMASGSVISHFGPTHIKQMSIKLPSLDRQEFIGNFHTKLDEHIRAVQHQNTALEAIAQRLFRSWFVNFEPVHAKVAGKEPEAMSAELAALFPSEFEDSELGPIPKGWSVTSFGNAFDIKGGATPSTSEPLYWEGGTHAWATPKDMSSLASKVMYRTERQITAAGVAKISSKALPSGTVLMSSRAPVGYLAIAKAPISINQGFIAIPPTPGIPASYAVELLAHKMPDIKANAGGTTFAEISKTQFRPIKWTRPSEKVLTAFGKLVEPLYAQVHGNCLLVDSLARLRDHLLPRLISGKLSLAAAEQAVEEAMSA